MATAKQIAARKKFAERARSGELAKMRKKNPVKKPTRAASRKANPITETLIYGLPRGEDRDYMEELLYGGGLKLNNQQVNQVLKAASEAGYHSFRITGFDPTVVPDFGVNVLNRPKRKRNPTATRAPARKRTQLVSNGERKKNPATKDFFYVNVIDDGGFQFGMDDRTPVLFKFSNREMKRGVYRSFALPFNMTSNPEFQNFVKSLPGNQIVISLKDLRKNLSVYA